MFDDIRITYLASDIIEMEDKDFSGVEISRSTD